MYLKQLDIQKQLLINQDVNLLWSHDSDDLNEHVEQYIADQLWDLMHHLGLHDDRLVMMLHEDSHLLSVEKKQENEDPAVVLKVHVDQHVHNMLPFHTYGNMHFLMVNLLLSMDEVLHHSLEKPNNLLHPVILR